MCMASSRATSSGPPARTSTPILFAGGWTYADSTSLSPCFWNRVAPRIWMFSPSFPTSSCRCSSSSPTESGPSYSTVSSTFSAKARNSSFFDTGSVSQPTATSVPVSPDTLASTTPSVVSLPARLPASAMPRSRRSFFAASRSASVSWSARLASIIPAPVSSRSCFTSVAGMSAIGVLRRSAFGLGEDRLLLGGRRLYGLLLGRGRSFGLRRCRGWLLCLCLSLRRLRRLLGLAVGCGGRCLLELAGLDLVLPGVDPVGDRVDDQAARTDRVVVPRDHVVGLVRIGVRVHEPDHRQAKPPRLVDRDLLLAQVDDEDGVWLALEVGDPAEVRFELLELAEHGQPLLGGQEVELALLVQAPQLVEALDPGGHRPPIREQPAEPAVVDVGHADPGRLAGDRVHRLLLRAHEQDRAPAVSEIAREVVRLVDQLRGLLQINDVDAAALREDEAAHLRVPASGLVAEMHAGLQEVSHRDDCHGGFPPWFRLRCRRRDGRGTRAGRAPPLRLSAGS